jgi:hypothetical protein
MPVLGPCLSDVGEPGFERLVVMLFESRADTSAVIVPSDNDVLPSKPALRILQDSEEIDVRGGEPS